jgi:hypothetical protein
LLGAGGIALIATAPARQLQLGARPAAKGLSQRTFFYSLVKLMEFREKTGNH